MTADNVIRLATSQRDPATRACNTCRHRPLRINGFARCHATGNYIENERAHDMIVACGKEGRLWEPTPPRLGLIGTIRLWLWGDK